MPTLRERLPEDLRDGPAGPDFDALPFTSLYLTDDEWAAEIANRTMYGVMHLGWVPDKTGGYRGQLAVLVKPNGLLGTAYMAAIKPFRHLIVYPRMMRRDRAPLGGTRGPPMNRHTAIGLLDPPHGTPERASARPPVAVMKRTARRPDSCLVASFVST